MTDDDKANERLKLTANWLNSFSVAILTAGLLAPAAQFVFGILPEGTNVGMVYAVGGVCLIVGAGLHWLGQVALGGLE